jgi:hypothetical protein
MVRFLTKNVLFLIHVATICILVWCFSQLREKEFVSLYSNLLHFYCKLYVQLNVKYSHHSSVLQGFEEKLALYVAEDIM